MGNNSTMTHAKYDIFISYRRSEGQDIARMMKESLERKGYRVFLDMDELQDGVFDQRILDAIQSAPIFIILLTAHALDRCQNEQDWVRQEIEYALFSNKHIIPINPDKQFTGYSDSVPENIQNGLKQHQYSAIDTGQLYQESINKLVKERLKPILQKKWWRWLIVSIGIIVLLTGGFGGLKDYQHKQLVAYYTEMGDKFDSILIFEGGFYDNMDSAFYYYHLGAIEGDPYCQWQLSQLYGFCLSTNVDNDSAFYWAQRAYQAGCIGAIGQLGYCYKQGIGVKQDYIRSLELFKEGTELGDLYCQAQLGTMQRQGMGTKRDFVTGSYNLVKAAQAGDWYAETTLGKLKTWVFYPNVDSVTDPLVSIKALSWSTDDTLRLYCEWHNKYYKWMQIDHEAYVENASTQERYTISNVYYCKFSPDTTLVPLGTKHYFALAFAGVPDTVNVLNFYENDPSDWNFLGIHVEEKIRL